MSTKTLSEATEIIQNNLDYTLFSWSKQKGIAPIAVKRAEGVYLYDYDDKRYIDFSSGLDECKYWSWQPTYNRCSGKANAGSKLCNAKLCNQSTW